MPLHNLIKNSVQLHDNHSLLKVNGFGTETLKKVVDIENGTYNSN